MEGHAPRVLLVHGLLNADSWLRLLAARLPQGRLLEFPDEKHELYNAGNAGLAAFLGAVLDFFGLTAGYGKGETK